MKEEVKVGYKRQPESPMVLKDILYLGRKVIMLHNGVLKATTFPSTG